MILQKEIRQIAQATNVPNGTIDKDWVLGHVLNAVYCTKVFSPDLIFKGGTALRKLYYKDYRFSEDLDFTTVNQTLIVSRENINQILDFATTLSGIKFYIDQHNEMIFQDRIVGYQSTIKYWGADHPKNQIIVPVERWHTFIKIEIVTNEILINPIKNRRLIHNYSDSKSLNIDVPCYSITEMIAEKLRATLQRKYTAPRDYFDLWYLIKNEEIDWDDVKNTFIEKARLKSIDPKSLPDMFSQRNYNLLMTHWSRSLGNHLSKENLPLPENVFQYLKEIILENVKF